MTGQANIQETVKGIVERITYHNDTTGWTVLKVASFKRSDELVTVTVHQTRVFAGATMEFKGQWTLHQRFGRQFKALFATELKPATSGALEKYLGSGLIKGVGPKTAKKIVRFFGEETLDIFEGNIDRLVDVPGIAEKKLATIKEAWREHRSIRDVMMFLQSHGISTLFAVRIFKQYGEAAIQIIRSNPYRLAVDFYGIGFFTADRVALSIGFGTDSEVRVLAGIRHLLSASREQGHCYLTQPQIVLQIKELLGLELESRIPEYLAIMEQEKQLALRILPGKESGSSVSCYYAKTLYNDESYVGQWIAAAVGEMDVDKERVGRWLQHYRERKGVQLSNEQAGAVGAIICQKCSVLTGGPGCGKTTTTRVLVALLQAMRIRVMLAAPTGRASQRMSEVIGVEAKTIHRLLEFQGTGFKRNLDNPLDTDFLIIDESSMLDISLSASLLKAIATETAVLFIGDADQLPSVGAGNVLKDMIHSKKIPCFRLNTIYRQAHESVIISSAHAVNSGEIPRLESPFKNPQVWQQQDCFFIDTDEVTQGQLSFVAKVKKYYGDMQKRENLFEETPFLHGTEQLEALKSGFEVPEPFSHVSLGEIATSQTTAQQLLAMAKKTHPWSALYFGLTAVDTIRKLYSEWIPKYLGQETEIQVLCPMIRGSLGARNLNTVLQQTMNPPQENKAAVTLGEKVLRVGDRVIHRVNNYDLNVFNGDIGSILSINNTDLTCKVSFYPDNKMVEYQREHLTELDLAYAITIHKSQGSEFDAVIIPVHTQHFKMLFRNLLYTGLTRGKKLVIMVGTRRAMAMAVKKHDTGNRQTALVHLLQTGTN